MMTGRRPARSLLPSHAGADEHPQRGGRREDRRDLERRDADLARRRRQDREQHRLPRADRHEAHEEQGEVKMPER